MIDRYVAGTAIVIQCHVVDKDDALVTPPTRNIRIYKNSGVTELTTTAMTVDGTGKLSHTWQTSTRAYIGLYNVKFYMADSAGSSIAIDYERMIELYGVL